MSVTPTPAYTQSPVLDVEQVTTANTNRDGSTGTYSSSYTPGGSGALIDYILFKATGNTAAGTLRIFFSANNSTNWRLIGEVTAVGVTASGTLASEQQIWIPPGGVPLNLPAAAGIRYNVNNSETWNVFAHGGAL